MQESKNLTPKSDFDNCQNLITKLKKNRESVQPELLKTRYAKAYQRLLAEVKDSVEEVLYQFFFSDLLLYKASSEELKDFFFSSQEIIDQEKAQINKMSHVIFSEYDLTKAIGMVEPIKTRIFLEAYNRHIWSVHCTKKNGHINNDLIDMFWHPENDLWMAEDGKSSMVMLPPA